MILWTQPLRIALAALCIGPLSGCMGSGFDLLPDRSVDRGVRTSAVAERPDSTSDATTVGNAVSSADLARNAGNPIPWANAASGSAGIVSSVAESSDGAGRTCRDFTTTLHSYSGIANYDGRTCTGGNGLWTLTRFDRQG